MNYRKFPGTEYTASALGFGTMRLPTLQQEGNPVDEKEAIRIIRAAIDGGCTYMDTAYVYHGGNSEVVLGKALKDGYRDRVMVTTKLPMWAVNEPADMERILDEQLKRLQLDYVDLYLLHALSKESFEKCVKFDYKSFLQDMQKKGKIRLVGFSFHDEVDVFETIARDYTWNAVQVQMNVLDEFKQATMAKATELARELGFGLIIMEPLRGGALANNVPEDVKALYAAQGVQRSPVEWAFRYLYDRPEIVTILSGMSTMEQVQDNLRIFDQAEPNCLTQQEKEMLAKVRAIYEARVRVGCTGCEYCMPCPCGVNIPRIFRTLDQRTMFGVEQNFKQDYAKIIEKGMDASLCVHCGSCESVCPQHFAIPDLLAAIHEEFA